MDEMEGTDLDREASQDTNGHRPGWLRVGMALKAEKAKKHVSDKLVAHAAEHKIDITVIDEHSPLADQGEFDVILQKIRRKEWEEELEQYLLAHPNVRICDPPKATYPLRNRGTMLRSFAESGATILTPPPNYNFVPVRCTLPPRTILPEGASLEEATRLLDNCRMSYPVLAKSLWADGRPGSHALGIVQTATGMQQLIQGNGGEGLQPPLVLEQYVDHGACLFKVYVLGEESVMVTRPTLHLETASSYSSAQNNKESGRGVDNIGSRGGCSNKAAPINEGSAQNAINIAETPEEILSLGHLAGTSPPVLSEKELRALEIPPLDLDVVSRVSAYPRSRSWGKDDLAPKGHGVPPLPEWVWRGMAARLRNLLGLSLFNFDLIVPVHPPEYQRGLLQSCTPSTGAADETVVTEGLVHLIDINYYPGIEKLPRSEEVIVRFLNSLR